MGPLEGYRVVELAGIGPAPMGAMLLADLGAEVLRLDRIGPSGLGIEKPARFELTHRSRRAISFDSGGSIVALPKSGWRELSRQRRRLSSRTRWRWPKRVCASPVRVADSSTRPVP